MTGTQKRWRIGAGCALLQTAEGWYHVQFYDKSKEPRRKTLRLATKTHGVAWKAATEKYQAWEWGQFDPWHEAAVGLTLREAYEQYKSFQRRDGKTPATLRTYDDRIGGFVTRTGESSMLPHLTAADVQREIRRPGLSQTSRYTRYQTLHAWLAWCVERGMIKANPATGVSRPDKPAAPSKYLTRAQFAALLKAIDAADAKPYKGLPRRAGWVRPVCELIVVTGLRIGEAARLRWRDVELSDDTGWIVVSERAGRAKWDSYRRIPLPPAGVRLLAALHDARPSEDDDAPVLLSAEGKPIHPDNVRRAMRDRGKDAKLPMTVGPHLLRHTYASWLAMAGVDMYRIQMLLGHKDAATTQRYAHLAPEHLAEGVARAFGEL
jgi:integrase/recombinase XerC